MSRYAWPCLLLITSPACAADPLQVISWNVESGGADPAVIARQLGELPAAAIFALQEVHGDDIGRYGNAIRQAHGREYRFFASWTGRSDRMMIVYDASRLALIEWRELFQHGDHELNDWRHRSPLIAVFEDAQSGERFCFLTVHLARGNTELRASQAAGLAEWAGDANLPIIAAGDFNFDYNFQTNHGNEAMNAFTRGGVWTWARPVELIDTNWSDRNGDGIDDYPDSCLDFAFVAGLPDDWEVTSEVIVRPGDFPDDERTSDHRPVRAVVTQ